MFEKIYLGSIIFFFIAAFAVRNIKTYLNTGVSIKGKSKTLSLSIVFTSLVYISIILRLSVLNSTSFLEFYPGRSELVTYIGYVLVGTGFIIGILALNQMKNSWRVGIKYEQKTELVTSGIYRYSRNPYFLSYSILIFGFILIFPSVFLIIPYLVLIALMHMLVLAEEKYLEKTHGQEYLNYKNKTGRYLTI